MATDRALVILGAGGHGRVAASTARACGWTSISFLDTRYPDLVHAGSWRVEGDGRNLALIGVRSVIVAIGDNQRRLAQIEACRAMGVDLTTLVHPTAWVCPSALLGDGTVVFAQAAVNHGASIGTGAIINTGAIIEHDCRIRDGAHISPGVVLAGSVTVGIGAWVGAGASVRQGLDIGEGALVGAGAVVVTNVPAYTTYVGVPARPLAR